MDGESSEISAEAPIGRQSLVRSGRRPGVGRPSLSSHEVHHHVPGRRVDDVRAGAALVPLPMRELAAVSLGIAVRIQKLAEADKPLGFVRERDLGQSLPQNISRRLRLTAVGSRRGEDEPIALKVVKAFRVNLASRVDLSDPVMDDELPVFVLISTEWTVVGRIALQRRPRLFRGRLVAGERYSVVRHDVHAHVAGVAVRDVSGRVEVRGRSPRSVRVFNLAADELVRPDELLTLAAGLAGRFARDRPQTRGNTRRSQTKYHGQTYDGHDDQGTLHMPHWRSSLRARKYSLPPRPGRASCRGPDTPRLCRPGQSGRSLHTNRSSCLRSGPSGTSVSSTWNRGTCPEP